MVLILLPTAPLPPPPPPPPTGGKKQSCDAPICKQESHIPDRCSYFTGQLFVSARKAIQYSDRP